MHIRKRRCTLNQNAASMAHVERPLTSPLASGAAHLALLRVGDVGQRDRALVRQVVEHIGRLLRRAPALLVPGVRQGPDIRFRV